MQRSWSLLFLLAVRPEKALLALGGGLSVLVARFTARHVTTRLRQHTPQDINFRRTAYELNATSLLLVLKTARPPLGGASESGAHGVDNLGLR